MKINNINIEAQANTSDAVGEFWGLFWFVAKILSVITGVLDHNRMQNMHSDCICNSALVMKFGSVFL